MGHALDQLSLGDMLIGGFGLLVVVGILGAVTHAILRDSGFGVIFNGGLMLVGAVGGAIVRSRTLGF